MMFVYRVDALVDKGMISNIKFNLCVHKVNVMYSNVCVYSSHNLNNFTLGRNVVIECFSYDDPGMTFDRVDDYVSEYDVYYNTDILYCGNPIVLVDDEKNPKRSELNNFGLNNPKVDNDRKTYVMNFKHMYRQNNTDVQIDISGCSRQYKFYDDFITGMCETANNITDLSQLDEKYRIFVINVYTSYFIKCDGVVWFTFENIRHGRDETMYNCLTVSRNKNVNHIPSVYLETNNSVVMTHCVLYKTKKNNLKVTCEQIGNLVCEKVKTVGDYNYYVLNIPNGIKRSIDLRTEDNVDAYVVNDNVLRVCAGVAQMCCMIDEVTMFTYHVKNLVDDGMINNIKFKHDHVIYNVNILHNNVLVYTSKNIKNNDTVHNVDGFNDLNNFTLGRNVVIECFSYDDPGMTFDRVDDYVSEYDVYYNTDILYCGNPIVLASDRQILKNPKLKDLSTYMMNFKHMYRQNNTDVELCNHKNVCNMCAFYDGFVAGLCETTNNITDLSTLDERNRTLIVGYSTSITVRCEGIVWFTFENIRYGEANSHVPFLSVCKHNRNSLGTKYIYRRDMSDLVTHYALYRTTDNDLKVVCKQRDNLACEKIKTVGDYNYYIFNIPNDVGGPVDLCTGEIVEVYTVSDNVYVVNGGGVQLPYCFA